MEKEKQNIDEPELTVEEKAQALIDEQIDGRIKAALKEQFKDAVSEIKAQTIAPSPELLEAEKKAKEFKSFDDFIFSIYLARTGRSQDNRLSYIDHKNQVKSVADAISAKTAGHYSESDDTEGGFLVPDEYRAQLYQLNLEAALVRPRATVIPMRRDTINIPYVDDTSHATNVFGGVTGYWTKEATAPIASKAAFGQMSLTAHKLMGLTYASRELLDDGAVSLAPLIMSQFGQAIPYFEDDAFIQGTGAGQPLGVQNCNCVVNNYRNTASVVYLEDLAEMWSRLLPTSMRNAVWVINPTVLPELIELGTGNATAASGKNLIWINSAAEGPPMRIFGRPVIVSEKMQALGTAGDIGLYDFRYYLIGDRQPVTIDTSAHVAFTTDEIAWRFVLRVAGQCWPQTAMTLRRGGTTVSPFVQLHADTS
jgi:HK97 family phage major capsid protein